MGGSNQQRDVLMHFYVCVCRDSVFGREEFEGRVLTPGLFPSSKCGRDGPLNVEIRESVEHEAERLTSTY
jgi:hypothetical protein